MKQIEVMFERFIEGKKPLTAKWQMRLVKMKRTTSYDDSENVIQCLLFTHYHHNIYIWDIDNDRKIYSFSEKKADERGLEAIYHYLRNPENKKCVIEASKNMEHDFKICYDADYIMNQEK